MSCPMYTDMTETPSKQLSRELRLWAQEALIVQYPQCAADMRRAADEIERLTANNVRLAETLIRVMAIVSEPDAGVPNSVLIRLSSLS